MNILHHIRKFGSDQSGMTLIDMCILLIVISLLTIPLIKGYDNWKYNTAAGISANNQLVIQKAISDFFYENARYPCPSRLNTPPNDPANGVEDCTIVSADGTHRTGAVPFATLKISPSYALDGWSNKLTYTVAPQVSPLAGPLSLTTNLVRQRFMPSEELPSGETVECSGTLDTPQSDFHFFLVSHGPRGVGATNASGQPTQACPVNNPPLEAENCDGDATFFDSICARSTVNNASYYDDIILGDDDLPSRMWVYSTTTPPDPTDIVSTVTQIGINNPTPFGATNQTGVDVGGNVLVGDNTGTNPSFIISDNLCDAQNGEVCFSPNLLISPASEQNHCDHVGGGNLMRGIGNIESDPNDNRQGARVLCQNSFYPSASFECPANQRAIGFSGGRIRCQ